VKAFTFGEPHSLRRYIEFGIVAGVVAGIISAVFGVSLALVITLAAGVAAGLAGHDWGLRSKRSLHSGGSRNIPIFVILAAVIALVSIVSRCGGIMLPTPGMHQQSGPSR